MDAELVNEFRLTSQLAHARGHDNNHNTSRFDDCDDLNCRKRVKLLADYALATLAADGAEVEQRIITRIIGCYNDHPVAVAKACDELIDPSGNLLGWLRDAAALGLPLTEKG